MLGMEMMLSALGLSPEKIMEMAKELGVQQFLENMQATAARFEERLERIEQGQLSHLNLLNQILESTDGQAAAGPSNPDLPVMDKLPPFVNGVEHVG